MLKKNWLLENDLSCDPASLQVVEDGYEFFAKRQLVTLFSAPNYCGEFDNAGGMMSVDESLMCSFQVKILVVSVWRSYSVGFSVVVIKNLFFEDTEALREKS